jgi:hypothetical protein
VLARLPQPVTEQRTGMCAPPQAGPGVSNDQSATINPRIRGRNSCFRACQQSNLPINGPNSALTHVWNGNAPLADSN